MFIVFCRATHSFDLNQASCGRNIPITTGKPDLVKEKMCAQHCVNGTERDKKKERKQNKSSEHVQHMHRKFPGCTLESVDPNGRAV
jgi:hypothetical protein